MPAFTAKRWQQQLQLGSHSLVWQAAVQTVGVQLGCHCKFCDSPWPTPAVWTSSVTTVAWWSESFPPHQRKNFQRFHAWFQCCAVSTQSRRRSCAHQRSAVQAERTFRQMIPQMKGLLQVMSRLWKAIEVAPGAGCHRMRRHSWMMMAPSLVMSRRSSIHLHPSKPAALFPGSDDPQHAAQRLECEPSRLHAVHRLECEWPGSNLILFSSAVILLIAASRRV